MKELYQYPKICQELNNQKIKFRCLGAVRITLSDANNYNFVLYAGKIRDFDILAALYICKDLYIYKTEEFLLISRDKVTFSLIKDIIKIF